MKRHGVKTWWCMVAWWLHGDTGGRMVARWSHGEHCLLLNTSPMTLKMIPATFVALAYFEGSNVINNIKYK